MTRDEMAKLAQATANSVQPPEPGVRVAVIVTDEAGDFIGVGSNQNSSVEDLKRMCFCALYGEDRVDHRRIKVVK
jgi:hypothetical protein